MFVHSQSSGFFLACEDLPVTGWVPSTFQKSFVRCNSKLDAFELRDAKINVDPYGGLIAQVFTRLFLRINMGQALFRCTGNGHWRS